MPRGYYIEVVDLDGLRHHVGPFKKRSNAHDWIRQYSVGGDQHETSAFTGNRSRLRPVGDFLPQE